MSDYKDYTDLDLLKNVAKYDSRALEALYDRYAPLLFTVIKKISPDEETANTTLIEVFKIIWKKAALYNLDGENVYTWLVTLARNKAVDGVRRSRSTSANLDPYTDEYEDFFIIPSISNEAQDMNIDKAMSKEKDIERALSKLTDAQKYVIHLAYYEGYSLNEISDKLNIPVETIRNKILVAMQSLNNNMMGTD